MTDLTLNQPFELITDTVMGGVSRGTLTRETTEGFNAYRMRGRVSLENNGGFIQMAMNLQADGSPINATSFTGIALDVIGNRDPSSTPETYNIHLRTNDLTRPWQSYRQSFLAGSSWETHHIPFSDFVAHRTDAPLDLTKLRRIGILAIGREFEADVSIRELCFY